ncbi:DNA polymerase III subunit delta [Fulvivirgaceae bacterium PWU4]|uniref:DNA polymerase III subunit delta n=1 Tax=Chryseosolibacter histidini TaxID=2782349 RepID=A0AAP2DPD9_9BACT|nr:DNA polymerase III subunit delta [Chryseosolibacter histidini]MBT1700111.1 DNA polymerase III subunit delta [Chryseosolibacter histidini]
MDANVKKILTDLKAGKYAPVYFLQGEETFYIDLIADYVEAHALTDAEKGFNQVIVYGKDVAMATVLTHARRFPMMAQRQVVIVKEAQDIQDLNKEAGAKLLLDYITKAVPSTVLVFCHKHKSLDKRRELGKKIEQYTVTLNTKRLYDNQLPEFVAEYVKDKKISMEDRAIATLCEYVGNDLHRLANEIDKLSLGLSGGAAITPEQVMNQVGVSKEYNIFELQKAILQRDTLLANRIVNFFESNTKKNPMIPVVAYLFSFFSKLLAATQAPDKSDKGLVSALKISPYSAKDYSLALRQYPLDKIIENISSLKEADLKLKGVNSGSDTEGQIFRELVYRIMH